MIPFKIKQDGIKLDKMRVMSYLLKQTLVNRLLHDMVVHIYIYVYREREQTSTIYV